MSAPERNGPGGAAIPAVINALINGTIAYNSHSGRAEVPLTLDAISSTEATVGSEMAMMALALSVILTSITALIARKGLRGQDDARGTRPFFPTVPVIAFQNALMLFGATVVAAVMWQRTVGTVMVTPMTAALLVALFAAAATVFVHTRTIAALVRA